MSKPKKDTSPSVASDFTFSYSATPRPSAMPPTAMGPWGATSERLVHQAKAGVAMAKVQDIREAMGLSLEELAELLHISMRTLQRRESTDVMSTPISERILQFEQLLEQGHFVFNDPKVFQGWLREPIQALGDRAPFTLLDTTFGVAWVSQMLGRIAFGVYS